MAAFLCSFCGSLEASVAVFQLSASCWLTLLSSVHTPRTQRQRLALSVISPPQTGKDRPVFFSLWTPDPSSLKHPRHRQQNICLLKSHFPSSSPRPSFVFTAQICCRTRDQSGGWFTGRSQCFTASLTVPADPRLTAGRLAWLAGWLCCSPRSCLPHWRAGRLILTYFSPIWSLMSRVQKPREVIFRTYKKCIVQNWAKGFFMKWLASLEVWLLTLYRARNRVWSFPGTLLDNKYNRFSCCWLHGEVQVALIVTCSSCFYTASCPVWLMSSSSLLASKINVHLTLCLFSYHLTYNFKKERSWANNRI